MLGAQSDGFRSFALFLYPDIQWGGEQVQIGFSSGAILFFMLPAARSPAVVNIDDGSNVGTPGLYVFRVDTTLVVKPGGQFCARGGVHICLWLFCLPPFQSCQLEFSLKEMNL